MSSPDLQTVVIACPNCGTRYQVPYGTIGAAGREVQCAQCSKPWHATADAPPPLPVPVPAPARNEDTLFSPAQEQELDAVFEAEARATAAPALPTRVVPDEEPHEALADIRAALAPKRRKAEINAIDPALLSKSKRAFAQRQAKISKKLPMARVRRTARLGAFVLLVSILLLGFSLRTDLVRWFPALAGLYASIGLPVNVVGLTFENSKTLTSFRDGKPVMLISSRIRSVASQTISVPPVLVSLVDPTGSTVYEWTVTPLATTMAPGEILDFSTEVSAPPPGAATVRLSFTTPRAGAAGAPAGTV
jgi:predicted Zn finger-like uncharacterized protein